MSEPLLSVENLSVPLKLGRGRIYRAVDQLSLQLHPGKTLALVGESGCGKTMAALALLGLAPSPPALPSLGAVWYRGQNLLALSERSLRRLRGSRISMIFQDPTNALNPVYTIGQQIIEIIELHMGLYAEEARALAAAALRNVGIPLAEQRLDDYPHQLSGGMRQRVMIAMALICQPEILIADEPTTALDVTIQAQVLDLIRTLQKEQGMAVLLITHDLGVVAEIADEVIVMYAAQGVEYATTEQLFDSATHPYTQGLFASRPAAYDASIPLQPIVGSVPALGHYPAGCHFSTRCPFVMPKCRAAPIPLYSLESGQKTRCVLYADSALSPMQ